MVRPAFALVIGAFLGTLAGLAASFAVEYQQLRAARGIGPLEPVVVAQSPLAGDATVKIEDVSQHPVPARWATNSLIKPDSASYVLNQALAVPVASGQPLQWAFFSTPTADGVPAEEEVLAECERELDRRGVPRNARTVSELRALLGGK
ncbi:MAG: hypothetical protein U0228_31565 [Myxococcaceae bacterium]